MVNIDGSIITNKIVSIVLHFQYFSTYDKASCN